MSGLPYCQEQKSEPSTLHIFQTRQLVDSVHFLAMILYLFLVIGNPALCPEPRPPRNVNGNNWKMISRTSLGKKLRPAKHITTCSFSLLYSMLKWPSSPPLPSLVIRSLLFMKKPIHSFIHSSILLSVYQERKRFIVRNSFVQLWGLLGKLAIYKIGRQE